MNNCNQKHLARGYCRKHYARWQRYGSPYIVLEHHEIGKYTGCLNDCDKPHHAKGLCANCHQKIWSKNQRKENLQFKLAANLRSRFTAAIRQKNKTGSAVRDLGCSINELKQYLEAQFINGMNWENWSRDGWHIDHIVPLASFDLTDRDQFLKATHFTNLQPLWAQENLSKGLNTI